MYNSPKIGYAWLTIIQIARWWMVRRIFWMYTRNHGQDIVTLEDRYKAQSSKCNSARKINASFVEFRSTETASDNNFREVKLTGRLYLRLDNDRNTNVWFSPFIAITSVIYSFQESPYVLRSTCDSCSKVLVTIVVVELTVVRNVAHISESITTKVYRFEW